jgi:lysyl-tRNA synthetase class 1
MATSTDQLIGKGTWIDKVADAIIKREKKLGRSLDLIKVESGLGASGIPHIGSMGDAVRAYGIALALQNFGYRSELITYSDDMDGLRKIPTGLPNWLKDHLAKPVSNIPDPFGGCHKSYGAHMSGLLLDGLDNVGVKYRFQSGADAYKNGILASQTDSLLRTANYLGTKISEFVGQEKYNQTLPYFPICESCGRLYTAKAEKYLAEEKKVSYACSGGKINKEDLKGCGYTGELDIRKGSGKLAWKVEFAARWCALDIRFEAYGKDIMDSVRINDWVTNEILAYPHPFHVKYEMFLDKEGRKISKSTGNVLTPQTWLKYGTQNQAKLIKIKGIYEYVNHLNPPHSNTVHIPYRLLSQQASLFSDDDEKFDKIFERLVKYGVVKDKTPDIKNKIQLASNWIHDHLAPTEEKSEIKMNNNNKNALMELSQTLKSFIGREHDLEAAKTLQTKIFEIARGNGMEPKEFFVLLYRILINSDKGPKIGSYVLDLGIERSCGMIDRYLH